MFRGRATQVADKTSTESWYMQIWNIHSWSGSVRNKSALSKFREINFAVIILIGEVPGALSHALHIPSWDTECISLMVAELNRIWQVIRQKTLKQVFLISWKSGNMLKLELGAGGLSLTMQMNSPIKSFQILKRSSSPCRLQNQTQAGGSIWGNWWQSWASPLLVLWPRARPPRALCTSGPSAPSMVTTAPPREGCPGTDCLYHRPPWWGPSECSHGGRGTGQAPPARTLAAFREPDRCLVGKVTLLVIPSTSSISQLEGGQANDSTACVHPSHGPDVPSLLWAPHIHRSASVPNSATSHVVHLQCLSPSRPTLCLPAHCGPLVLERKQQTVFLQEIYLKEIKLKQKH